MRVLDLPDTLQTGLATASLTSILDYRYALAKEIELVRRRTSAEKHGAASTLLSTKPVKDWTADDHLLFMDASGDHRMPDGITTQQIDAPHTPASQPDVRRATTFAAPRDLEIPF